MLNLAGIDIPSFVKVTGLKYMVLPNMDMQSAKIYGRPGIYDFGVELGYRTIKVDVKIIGTNDKDVIKKTRLFGEWLFHTDLQPLIIADEPDKQYMARIDGQTEIDEIFRLGEGTITFIVPSPFAEATQDTLFSATITSETPVTVFNDGSAEAFPIIDLTMKEDATSIAVISDDKFVQIGSSDVTKTPASVSPTVLYDSFDSYSGWASATAVDGGVIAGSFTSNGFSISQTSKDYGTGSAWHGAAVVKSLSREVSNFTLTATVGHVAQNNPQIGRIEIYLLDANNVHLGKIALTDSHQHMAAPRFEARVGSYSGGRYFINDFGKKKGHFKNFDGGKITIYKKGNIWGAWIQRPQYVKGSFRYRTFYDIHRYFVDAKGTYEKKVAKVQIHMGTYGAYAPVNNMYISDLRVTERVTSSVTESPIIFKAGDVVTIDNQRAIVLKNGEPFFSELQPDSDFFSLQKGANGLIVSPPIADIDLSFRKRWY